MMRALRWHAAKDVRLEILPDPQPAPGEVLVQVDRAGLCGTDLGEFLEGPISIPVDTPHSRSGRSAPLVPGHEGVGTVVACPGGEVPLGTRVIPDVVLGCGTCWWCRA